jgi:transposase
MDKEQSKQEILRESGTLNPRPDSVTDLLFNGSDFFDSRDLVQVKYEMLRRVRDGKSVTEAAATFGFSRPSFYKAQSDFDGAGLAGLVPKRRGPRSGHKVTQEILEFIFSPGNASMEPATMVELIESKYDVRLHPRTIRRAIDRQAKKNR